MIKTAQIWDLENQQNWTKQTKTSDGLDRLDKVETVNDGGTRTTVDLDQDGTQPWLLQRIELDPNGGFLAGIEIGNNGVIAGATWKGATLGADIGGVIGSTLGRYLGGNTLVGQVAAGTLAGAIGKEIGNALQYGANFSLDVVVANGLANVPGGFAGGLPGAVIGAVSSLLIGEVADALNLSGFEGGLVQTVGTTVTAQLLSNAYGVVALGQPISTLTAGFNTVEFAGNITGAIGGYLGSTLAAHVVIPHYPEGAMGQQVGTTIGGAVGGMLGFAVGGPLGAFMFSAIGSFVGGGFGTFAGDLFGDEPEAHGSLVFNFGTHRFMPNVDTFGHSNGGNASTFYKIAEHTANVVNAFADFAGAQLEGLQTVVTPWGQTVRIEQKLHYKQDGRYYTINGDWQSPLILLNNVRTREDLAPLADSGIMQVLKNTDIVGGDPLMRLAWDNSKAENATAFGLDLQAAKDYRRYLDDKPMIDALMAAAPESSFTLGWLLTLMKARELGLDAAPASEDFRNGNDILNGTAGPELLIGGAGNDNINGGGGHDRIRGDAGDDILRGAAGDDIILGGAGTDTAHFAGALSAYTLTDLGGGVIEVAGPDGTDKLVQMERLQFDDKVVTLPLLRDLTATLSLSGITANIGVRNSGNIPAAATLAALYLSADSTVTTADTLIATSALAAVGAESLELRTLSFALPAGLSPGTYYLGAVADAGGGVAESNEANNVSAVATIILGNAAANTLAGTSGADTMFGLAGNDAIDGGGGFDTAVFAGARLPPVRRRQATKMQRGGARNRRAPSERCRPRAAGAAA